MHRRQFLYAFPAAATALVPLAGCGSSGPQWPKVPGPKVLVTFAPYHCFVANVLGDKGTVQSLLSTQGPHHADTNIATRTLIEDADLFFLNGLGLDDRLGKKLKAGSSNRKIALVKLGDSLDKDALIEGSCGCCTGHDSDQPHDHSHEGDRDPHVWLSPKLAIKLVEKIRDELKAFAPNFAPEYDANAAKFIATLEKIQSDGRDLLRERKNRKIVTVHESLAYFAQSFKLTIAGVIQKSPGQEPNPTQLADLIKACIKDQVRVIAVEPQFSSRGSVEVLKRELAKGGVVDPQVIELDPLETAETAALTPNWYEATLRKNLAELDRVML